MARYALQALEPKWRCEVEEREAYGRWLHHDALSMAVICEVFKCERLQHWRRYGNQKMDCVVTKPRGRLRLYRPTRLRQTWARALMAYVHIRR